jgi:hypothetical protein
VVQRLTAQLHDAVRVRSILPREVSAQQLSRCINATRILAGKLDTPYGKKVTLSSLLRQVQSGKDELVIDLDPAALGRAIMQSSALHDDAIFTLTCDATRWPAAGLADTEIGSIRLHQLAVRNLWG